MARSDAEERARQLLRGFYLECFFQLLTRPEMSDVFAAALSETVLSDEEMRQVQDLLGLFPLSRQVLDELAEEVRALGRPRVPGG